jgi:transposase
MSSTPIIEIKESLSELRNLLRRCSSRFIFLRLKMLLVLKKNAGCLSRRKLSLKLGVSPSTVQIWRQKYIEGGIDALLSHNHKGTTSKIFGEAEHQFLVEKLTDPQNGVQGYTELQQLLSEHFGKEISYKALHSYCRRHFNSKIKVARKSHAKKDVSEVIAFKENFNQKLHSATVDVSSEYSGISVYFEDESRFGLFTRNGKMLSARGIKSICRYHQIFKSTWLYGAFSPVTGDHFLLEFSHCDSECFQIFLDEFSLRKPGELLVLVLDNGAFHKAQALKIPKNVRLIFLPPYSPELNPAEKVWARLKRAFTNKFFDSIEQISEFISEQVNLLNNTIIKSICRCSYMEINMV